MFVVAIFKCFLKILNSTVLWLGFMLSVSPFCLATTCLWSPFCLVPRFCGRHFKCVWHILNSIVIGVHVIMVAILFGCQVFVVTILNVYGRSLTGVHVIIVAILFCCHVLPRPWAVFWWSCIPPLSTTSVLVVIFVGSL